MNNSVDSSLSYITPNWSATSLNSTVADGDFNFYIYSVFNSPTPKPEHIPTNTRERPAIPIKDLDKYSFKKEKAGYFINKMDGGIAKIRKSTFPKHLLETLGVESREDFLIKMAEKANNPNWATEDYELDHIWQKHWFFDYVKDECSDMVKMDKLLKTVNNHKNLRPLPSRENCSRSKKDYSPLKASDLHLYRDMLNIEILNEIIEHFNSPKAIQTTQILKKSIF